MLRSSVFQNTKWMIICKSAQALLQLLVGMISARYLGPSNYGLLNYAASLTALVLPFAQMGLQSTLVQEYVQEPEKAGEIMGTSLVMNLVSGLAGAIVVICFVATANAGETQTQIVCTLYSLCLIVQALEMLQHWFHANLLSKYSAAFMLIAYTAGSVYKICLLIAGKSIYWFALTHCVEYGMAGALMLTAYRKIGHQKIQFSAKHLKLLFSKSKYYILASLMVTIFQNTDHIMLKLISGDAANGYYTTAATCVCIANFVYFAVLDSFRPAILQSQHQSREKFESSMSGLYSIMIFVTLAQSICMTLFAEPIVRLLYGETYLQAVPVLRIESWILTFSYIGSVRDIWILAEEKHHFLWIINLGGVITNIILNGFMIPLWGACGAAMATVITQFITNVVLGFVIKPIRSNTILMLKGLNPRSVLKLMENLR